MLVFSYTLLPDESGIIDVILTVSDIWFYLLIFLGTMSVHEFTFARTFGTTAEDIRSAKRSANISSARQIAVYVVREKMCIRDSPLRAD